MLAALISFIVSIVAKVIAKFAGKAAKNIAAGVILVAAYVSLLAALAGVIALILNGLQYAIPPDLAKPIGMVKPDNFEACIAAILSTKVALWVYNTKRNFLEWQAMRKFV